MERVLKATPATISNSWYEDGVLVDPGTVTIDITRADGTVLINDGATTGTGAAARTYNLTAATHTNELDILTVAWASSTKGTMTDYVEVVGGYLFSLSELDAKLQTPASYTAAQKADARLWAEESLEDACGRAFVPRYGRRTFSGTGETFLDLGRLDIRSIRDATVDDEALTDLSVLVVNGGYLYREDRFDSGTRNWAIGFEYGLDYPPARVKQAAILLAKSWLVKGPIDDRATSMITEDGSFTLSTPGRGDVEFGIPEVDRVVQAYSVQTVVG